MSKKPIDKKPKAVIMNHDFNNIYTTPNPKPVMGAQSPIDLKEVRGKITKEHKKSQTYFNRKK